MNLVIANKKFLEETIELKDTIESSFLDLGQRLKRIRDERLYDQNYSSFAEYLMELDMNESYASRLIRVTEEYAFISPEKLYGIPWTTLYQSIRLLEGKTEEEKVELVEELPLLSRQAVEERVRVAKKGHDCDHDWLNLKICSKCQAREKVYPSLDSV